MTFTGSYALTEVTPATGGTNICFGGGYVTLGNIRIAEGHNSDFASSPAQVTYEISVPDNFEFEPGVGSVSRIGTKISGLSMTVTLTKINIVYTLINTDGGPLDGFQITGIRVRSRTSTSSGHIFRSGGTAVQNGNPIGGALNHGSLASFVYPLPIAEAGNDATIFLGNSIVIGGSPAASGSTGPYTYRWSPSAGLSSSSAANPVASPVATTTYSLIITDNNGCTDHDQITITVDQNIPIGPAVTASGPTSFCSGENVTLTSSETSGNQWYRNGSLLSGANNNQLIVNSSGSYQVKYHNGTVFSQLSDPVGITVNALPANKGIVSQETNLCLGGSTSIEVLTSEADVYYQLMQGVTNIGTEKSGNGSSVFLPTGSLTSGEHIFTVKATHKTTLCNRILSQSVNIQVEPSVAAPALTASPSNAVCGAQSITLTADVGYDQYKWYKNNIFLLNSTENILTLSNANESGLYKVIGVLYSSTVCESTYSDEIDIKLQPLPQQKAVAVADGIICKGTTTHAIVAGSELGIIYNLRDDIDNAIKGTGIAGTGGTIFLPTGIVNETTVFNVLATNGSTGCTVKMDDKISVNVNPVLVAEASTDTEEICLNGDDFIVLKASGSGGTGSYSYAWSGPDGFTSILQNPESFIPSSPGTHQYKVTIKDEIGCSAAATIQVAVNALPSVYLVNNTLNNIICDGDAVRFVANGAVEYEFSIDGIVVQERSAKNQYTSHTLLNDQKIRVAGFSNRGCSSLSNEQIVTVNPNPSSFFTGLDQEYCINDGGILLTGQPSGGVFTGSGIRGSEFIPEFAGIGSHSIRYTTVSTAGCDSTYSLTVTVKSSPVADYEFQNVCDGTAMVFEDRSTPEEEISTWEWDFGDGSSLVMAQNATHIFPGAGKYNVSLKVTSASGCYNVVAKQVTIGAIPQPNFSFQQICQGVATRFTNLSSQGIISYAWNFGDLASGANNISDLKDPEHVFSGVGAFNVSLSVTTELCVEIITKTVHILPSIGTGQYPYHEDFETGNGGWVPGGQNSSWMHAMPSGKIISKAGSGAFAWNTQANGDTYFDNEHSYVMSPCFDFSSLVRPMISLQIYTHTDKSIDGAVMQYSLDNGTTWQRLGNIGEGLEWYNQGSIISQPGGYSIGQEGWSGKDLGWKTARFNLDFLKQEPSVRFRIAFGSVPYNGNRGNSEGFSFDDVWIGERKRLVVMEHFTNASKSENEAADVYVNNLTAGNPADVVSIHYHTDRPLVTPINLDNTADPSARSQYYGISQTPRAVLDGNFYNGKSTDWNLNHLKYRSLVEPAFDININLPSTTNDQVEVDVTITAKVPFTDEVVVQIAVVEEEFFMNDGKIYHNVVKKLLPDGAGTGFSNQWEEGNTKTIRSNWNISKMYAEGRPLKVIVYVQNNVTKEILQASYQYTPSKRNSITTGNGESPTISLSRKLLVYPVPSDKEVSCIFENPLERKFIWKVSDIRGVTMGTGSLAAGTLDLKIDTSQYPEGLYILQLASDQKDHVVRKIIVKH